MSERKDYDPEHLKSMHETLSDFYPVAYLNAWAQGVRTEWAEFLDRVMSCYCSDLIERYGEDLTILDMGCGPSICNIMSASRISKKIYMADLLEGNRKEVKKWLNKTDDCWNWQPYFDFQGVLEISADTAAIEKRTRYDNYSIHLVCGIMISRATRYNIISDLLFKRVLKVIQRRPGSNQISHCYLLIR